METLAVILKAFDTGRMKVVPLAAASINGDSGKSHPPHKNP
jgi:hypothetical protein